VFHQQYLHFNIYNETNISQYPLKILIINITLKWVYKLYEEYILSIIYLLKLNYKNIIIDNIFIEESDKSLDNIFTKIYKYDKIFLSGNISYANKILNYKKILNNNFLYFINIEQLSHESYYNDIRKLDNKINIIDYSEENIPFLKNIYNNVNLIPPYFKYKFNLNINNKYIDIITIINNKYRENIFNNLNLCTKKYKIEKLDLCFEEKRDKYFENSKIYLNLHCSNKHQTMELIRIINLIMNKVIVITQKSIYSDLLFIKDSQE
jgi:hypothetical protein